MLGRLVWISTERHAFLFLDGVRESDRVSLVNDVGALLDHRLRLVSPLFTVSLDLLVGLRQVHRNSFVVQLRFLLFLLFDLLTLVVHCVSEEVALGRRVEVYAVVSRQVGDGRQLRDQLWRRNDFLGFLRIVSRVNVLLEILLISVEVLSARKRVLEEDHDREEHLGALLDVDALELVERDALLGSENSLEEALDLLLRLDSVQEHLTETWKNVKLN